jgi:hypothetical protein
MELLNKDDIVWLRSQCDEMMRAAEVLDGTPTQTLGEAQLNGDRASNLRRFATSVLVLLNSSPIPKL